MVDAGADPSGVDLYDCVGNYDNGSEVAKYILEVNAPGAINEGKRSAPALVKTKATGRRSLLSRLLPRKQNQQVVQAPKAAVADLTAGDSPLHSAIRKRCALGETKAHTRSY